MIKIKTSKGVTLILKADEHSKFKRLVVDINNLRDLTPERQKKIRDAIGLLEIVLNSIQFKEEFLSLKFYGQDERCNSRAYDMLMSGASNFGGPDGDLDLDLTYYFKRFSRVVGYGLPSSIRTWINGKFLDRMNVEELAGHLCHEYMHKLGFDDWNGEDSVPYQTGRLVEQLSYQQSSLDPLSLLDGV